MPLHSEKGFSKGYTASDHATQQKRAFKQRYGKQPVKVYYIEQEVPVVLHNANI